MLLPQTHYFFVFRVENRQGARYDERLPDGGISARGWEEGAIVARAFNEAYRRFPCKPHEMIVLVRVRDRTRRRQTVLMERDWERSFAKFESLMTVS